MVIAIAIAVGIIVLVLLGRTTKEKLVVSKVGDHPRYKNQIAFFSGVGVAALDGLKLPPELDNTPYILKRGIRR